MKNLLFVLTSWYVGIGNVVSVVASEVHFTEKPQDQTLVSMQGELELRCKIAGLNTGNKIKYRWTFREEMADNEMEAKDGGTYKIKTNVSIFNLINIF